jgi:hypothetical protein
MQANQRPNSVKAKNGRGFMETNHSRFRDDSNSIVAAEKQPPHFQTILAGGEKKRKKV